MNIQQTAFKFPKALYLSFFVIDFKLITYLNMKFPWNVAIFVLWLIMWFILSYSLGSRKYKISITGLMSRCWQGWSFLEALGKNPFLCLLQLLEAIPMPWLMALSCIFTSIHAVSSNLCLSLSDLCFHDFISFSCSDSLAWNGKDPCDDNWSHPDNMEWVSHR